MPSDPIVITEITVNGRTLRAEPPLTVTIDTSFGGELVQACCDFGCETGDNAEDAASSLRDYIETRIEEAEEFIARYRQRFKEVT